MSFARSADSPAEDITVPAALHWSGRQGIFPLAYRGWAVAGYNGDGDRASSPINEGDFIIDTSNLPTQTQVPSGFNDPNYNPPQQENSYAYLPSVQLVSIPGQGGPAQVRQAPKPPPKPPQGDNTAKGSL